MNKSLEISSHESLQIQFQNGNRVFPSKLIQYDRMDYSEVTDLGGAVEHLRLARGEKVGKGRLVYQVA